VRGALATQVPVPAEEWGAAEFLVQGRRLAARGITLRVRTQVGVAGWERLDAGARLLLDAMEIDPGARVLDLSCGYGALGMAAACLAGPEGHVDLIDSNLIAVHLAEANLAANGIAHARVWLSDGVQALGDIRARYDVVVSNLPVNAGRLVVAQLCADARHALRPGGRFYFAGPKAGGIETWIKRVRALFGNAETIAVGKGHRAALAIRDATPDLREEAPDYYRFRPLVVEVGGERIELITKPGIFSWDELDPATALLLEHLEIAPTDTVLDLGCGYGVIGVVAARRASRGRVYLVDSSCIAVEAARRSVAHNRLVNAQVILGDGPAALGDVLCDVIATNPPFHAGRAVEYDITRRLIEQAHAQLRPGGRLYLVSNIFIPYQRWIAATFGDCEVIARTRSFQVLRARRQG